MKHLTAIRRYPFLVVVVPFAFSGAWPGGVQPVFACYSWAIGQRVGLRGGAQIRTGSGLSYPVHTTLPPDANDWLVDIIGGPRQADGQEWWDISRRNIDGGGTGWVSKPQAAWNLCSDPSPGSLVVVSGLELIPDPNLGWPPREGNKLIGRFTLGNNGNVSLRLEGFGVRLRRNGSDYWDFLNTAGADLTPGATITFFQNNERPLISGHYRAEITWRLAGQDWQVANPREFDVGSAATPAPPEPFRHVLSPVMKSFAQGGSNCTSRFTLTNRDLSTATMAQVFFDQETGGSPIHEAYDTIPSQSSKTYGLGSYSELPNSYRGHLEIASDQPFDATLEECPAGNPAPALPPIILLPGIMGSRLRNTPTLSDLRCSNLFTVGEVWPNLPALGEARYNEGLRTLVLDSQTGTVADPPCNHITADGVFTDTSDLAPISDFYGDFADALDDDFAVYGFGYDWRLDLDQTVKDLDAFITSHGWTKVILVGHSMGGLLARTYIADPTRASRVVTVITVGTPYWGAPVMLQRMRQGAIDNWLVDLAANNDNMRDIARNAPGANQLLPSHAYFEFVDSDGYYQIDGHAYHNITDTTNFLGAAGQNRDLLLRGQTYHSRIDTFDALPSSVGYYILAADNTLTPTRLAETSQCWFFFRSCWEQTQLLTGDGAVPSSSASLGVLAEHGGRARICQYRPGSGVNSHGELVSDTKVIADIQKILLMGANPVVPFNCTMLAGVSASAVAGTGDLDAVAASPSAALQATLWGNADISLIDGFGHAATTTPQGLVQNDIPDVTFDPAEGSPSVIVPSSGVYTLTVHSTAGGPVQLRITDFSAASATDPYVPQGKAIFSEIDLAAGGTAVLRLEYGAGLPALQLHVHDAAGQETAALAPDNVLMPAEIQDHTAPATSLSVQGARGPLGFYTGPVTVSVIATDDATGVELTQLSLDDGQTWATYVGPLKLVAENTAAVLARSMDRAGNQEAPGAAVRLQPYHVLLPLLRR
jgi:pimeloyl-ACP methyl ester carboxylesterase